MKDENELLKVAEWKDKLWRAAVREILEWYHERNAIWIRGAPDAASKIDEVAGTIELKVMELETDTVLKKEIDDLPEYGGFGGVQMQRFIEGRATHRVDRFRDDTIRALRYSIANLDEAIASPAASKHKKTKWRFAAKYLRAWIRLMDEHRLSLRASEWERLVDQLHKENL